MGRRSAPERLYLAKPAATLERLASAGMAGHAEGVTRARALGRKRAKSSSRGLGARAPASHRQRGASDRPNGP